MITARRTVAAVLVALSALVLVSCAEDDPITIEVTTQDDVTTTGPTDEPEESTEPVAFPPINPDVTRPAEIVDLRGQASVEIEIRDNVFDERYFRVDPGTQIVFVDRGANTHDVTPAADGAFPEITKESLAEAPQALVLDAVGDYAFYCSIHGTATRGQTGYVVVGGA
ncbi:MAG: hypothetical protein RIB98_15955 [Acidimicrobiales bacterium]